MPGEPGENHGEIGPQLNVEDRTVRIARMRVEPGDVGSGPNDPLGDEESGSKLLVVPRAAERDGDGAGIDPDLERFFRGQDIGMGRPAPADLVPMDDGRRLAGNIGPVPASGGRGAKAAPLIPLRSNSSRICRFFSTGTRTRPDRSAFSKDTLLLASMPPIYPDPSLPR